MYSFPYLETICGPMSSSNCFFLTCIQISQETCEVVWYSHLFKNVPQSVVIHTVRGFGVVSKAEVDVFLELSCFFSDPTDVGNSAFSKSSLNIWKFSIYMLIKPSLDVINSLFNWIRFLKGIQDTMLKKTSQLPFSKMYSFSWFLHFKLMLFLFIHLFMWKAWELSCLAHTFSHVFHQKILVACS